MGSVFIEHLDDKNPRLVNTTGADIAQYQLVVMGGLTLIANEAILDGATGSFQAIDGSIVHIGTADLTTGELTFGTANADVFWDPATGKFSDTSTEDYYKIGTVVDVKNAAGKVGVRIKLNADLIAAAPTT